MKLHYKLIFSLFALALSLDTKGQDIHFSQFYASPLSLSPSHTGNYDGDWRYMQNYRRQWKSITVPFSTMSFGFDRQFYLYNEHLSGGIIFLNDKSGDSHLTANKLLLSAAYHKIIGDNIFHGGLQFGYVNKSFSYDKLTFPDQYDIETGEFNGALPNNEDPNAEQLSYIDLNLGLGWTRHMGKLTPHVHFAVFHLNKPKETFFGGDNRLTMRKVLSAGARYELNTKMFLRPNLLIMGQTKATDFLLGTNLGFYLPENNIKAKSVFVGILGRDGLKRNTDAFIAIAGINFKKLDLGISYDFNISDLHIASSYRGAIEFSLIYTGLSTVQKQIAIPCDRY